ncbi:MAG: helix-turn-helix transcriptional regulator [Brachymonas sp.]|nr:helix-turn-helix transcriptional regulator [Brachymonas sp.]
MSASNELIRAIKAELKDAGVTYAELAQRLGMAESSIKRMFAKADMPLSRIDAICRALRIDFADLAQRAMSSSPPLLQLTLEQERAVVANDKLLLVAISAMSQWTLEHIISTYRISEAECITLLAQLDRIGILELRPHNRYRLKVGKGFRWRPNGPVMEYFREHVLLDYFGGHFGGEDECLQLVHGTISRADAPLFLERIRKIVNDFAQQHLSDQKAAPPDREGYTLVLAMRAWEFAAFKNLRRAGTQRALHPSLQTASKKSQS